MNASIGSCLLEAAREKGTLKEAPEGVRYSVEPSSRPGYLALTIWVGKSLRPVYNYLVSGMDFAMARVAEYSAAQVAKAARRAERKKEKSSALAEQRARFSVGSVVVNSWGYDQTNIDFYQVVEISKSRASVKLRKIGSRSIEATGYMSEKVSPAVDHFIGEAFTKRITEWGVSFTHGSGRLCDADSVHYRTWYA